MIIEQNRTATLVSARDLHRIVEKAIAAAGHRTENGKGLIIRWDLIGRQLASIAEAETFAHSVTNHVSAAGIEATPAVLTIDNKIIGGFFERSAVPQIREL